MIIEGKISVKFALLNDKRKVNAIYLSKNKNDKDINFIKKIAVNKGVEIVYKHDDFFLSYQNSGKVLAEVEQRIGDFELEKFKNSIMMIDGIEDPFNLGYIFRNGACFNYDFIIKARDYTSLEATILKSSAGAFDLLNIHYSLDFKKTIIDLKLQGYKIYALQRNNTSKSIYDVEYHQKSVFILGGEKRGISKEILSMCDEYIYIPYNSNFKNALNATSASAIIMAQRSFNVKD